MEEEILELIDLIEYRIDDIESHLDELEDREVDVDEIRDLLGQIWDKLDELK